MLDVAESTADCKVADRMGGNAIATARIVRMDVSVTIGFIFLPSFLLSFPSLAMVIIPGRRVQTERLRVTRLRRGW